MAMLYERPRSLTERPFIYCPGCNHGYVHKLVAEAIDDLGVQDSSVCVSSIGCSVRVWRFLDIDICQAAHGRAMAVATGIKRCRPDNVVFTYQGDGDLVGIGMAETMHAAARGENLTVIFVNNAIYGATGGQLAPTSLLGQSTTTTPGGRMEETTGRPIRMAEVLAGLDSTAFIARAALNSPRHMLQARKLVRQAFQTQLDGKGFAMVELLAACPTNLKLSPSDSLKWVEEKMIPYYPLGVLKSPETAEEGA